MSVATTGKLTTVSMAAVITTAKAMTTSLSTLKASTTIASAGLVKQNATASAAKSLFTGAAAHGSSNAYTLVSGGIVGVLAMFFL